MELVSLFVTIGVLIPGMVCARCVEGVTIRKVPGTLWTVCRIHRPLQLFLGKTSGVLLIWTVCGRTPVQRRVRW